MSSASNVRRWLMTGVSYMIPFVAAGGILIAIGFMLQDPAEVVKPSLTEAVDAIQGTHARIMDTRKTLPGLRIAQKYAVSMGGGLNQRIGLYDGILIKENHIAAAGSIPAVLKEAAKISAPNNLSVQIEVENLVELEDALNAGAKLILLDNFDIPTLKQAVEINAKRAILEASGGIDLSNVREIAMTGVDRISIGGLTKNIQAIDLSMRFRTADFKNQL